MQTIFALMTLAVSGILYVKSLKNQSEGPEIGPVTGKPPVAIMTAMPQELAAIKRSLTEPDEVSLGGGFIATEGLLHGRKVVVMGGRIGKSNAAMAATLLIKKYSPSRLIFTGVAGAINPDFRVGDVIIAGETFQYDYGHHSAEKGFVVRRAGSMPDVGVGTPGESHLLRLGTRSQIEGVLKTVRAQVDLGKSEVVNAEGELLTTISPSVYSGRIASGDRFVAGAPEVRANLQALGADAVEMEGASVALVAEAFKVPLFLIRGISDEANPAQENVFFHALNIVADNTAKVVIRLLELEAFPEGNPEWL